MEFTAEQLELAAKCTRLQRNTVVEMVSSGSTQRQAYIKAGGKAKTVTSQDTAASSIMRNMQAKAFYESLIMAAQTKAVLRKEEALLILTQSAKAKITDVLTFKNVEVGTDENGLPVMQSTWSVKDSDNIPDNIASSIKSVTATGSGLKIDMYDSHGAIKQLSEMLGWNAPKQAQVAGPGGERLSLDVSALDISEAVTNLLNNL